MIIQLPEWILYAATWLCGASIGAGALLVVAITQGMKSNRKETKER